MFARYVDRLFENTITTDSYLDIRGLSKIPQSISLSIVSTVGPSSASNERLTGVGNECCLMLEHFIFITFCVCQS